MRIFKYLGIGVVAVIFLAVAAAAVLVAVVDPNDFKPQIAQAVRDQTGRELALDGALELSLFPWLGIKIGPTRLANAEGFGAQPFAEVQELDVKVRIAALVERRIEADTVTVKGLKLHLQRKADGSANWDDLVQPPDRQQTPSKSSGDDSRESSGPTAVALTIGGIKVIDAELTWDDRQAATQLALRKLNLDTGPVSLSEPLSFKSRFELESGSTGIEGTAALDGSVGVNLADQRIELSDGSLKADFTGAALEGGGLNASVDFSARFDLGTQALDLEVPALAFEFSGGVMAAGRLQGESNFSGQYDPARQRLRVPEGSVSLALEGGPMEQGSARSVLGFNAVADLGRQTLEFDQSRLSIDLEGGPLGVGRIAATLDFAAAVDLIQQRLDLRSGSLDLSAEGEPLGGGSLVAGGELSGQVDFGRQTILLPENSVRMALSGGPWGEGSVSGRLQTAGLVDLSGRVLQLNDGRLRFEGKDGPLPGAETSGSFEFPTLEVGLDRSSLDLGQSILKLQMSAGPLGAEGTLKAGLDFSARGNLEKGVVRFPESALDLSVKSPEHLGGNLDARLDFTAEADIGQQAYSLDEAALKGHLTGPGLPKGGLPTALVLSGALNLATQKLSVPRLEGRLLDVPLRADLNVERLLDDPSFWGSIATKRFNPRKLLAAFGVPDPKTADPEVFHRASLETAFEGRASDFNLEGLKLSLDDSLLTGTLRVADVSQPTARFDLRLDQIDLDRYQVEGSAPSDAGEAPRKETGNKRGGGDAKGLGLPIDTLRVLDLEGRATLGRFKFNNLRTRNVVLNLSAKNGLVRIEPFSLEAYQGATEGALSLDVQGKAPRLAVRADLSDVAIEPLLKDLSGEASLSGKGDVRLDLQASGRTDKALLRSLQGTAAVEFRDGAIKGVNIAHTLRAAKARVKGRQPPENVKNETDFAELSGSAQITNGVLRNEDLYVKSPLLRITGKGDVDLPAETLDYLASATIVGTLKGQGGRDLADLEGVTVPVRAKGPLAKPDYQVDVQAMIAAYARSRAEQEINKALGLRSPQEKSVKEGKKNRKKKNKKKNKQTSSAESPEELGLEILRGLLEKQ